MLILSGVGPYRYIVHIPESLIYNVYLIFLVSHRIICMIVDARMMDDLCVCPERLRAYFFVESIEFLTSRSYTYMYMYLVYSGLSEAIARPEAGGSTVHVYIRAHHRPAE